MLALVVAAVAVGLDNFGAAIGIGLLPSGASRRWLVAAVFGAFEAGMPAVGLVVGRAISSSVSGAAPIAGGVIVGCMGAYSVVTALRSSRPSAARVPGLARLLVLGAVLSVDNLVVGFALGAYHVQIALAIVVIAVVSVALSLLGLELGSRLGDRVGERSEMVGGLALIAVGVLVGLGVH